MRGKERGKHDLVLVKTGKPCNKSHAKENPRACRKVGQPLDEACLARFQGVVPLPKSRVPTAGASVGVALGPEVDGEAALVRADKAMYVRKSARRADV